MNINIDDLIKAGNIHKQLKEVILPMLKPNMNIYDIAQTISTHTRNLTRGLSNEDINGGIAFTPNISINHIIAHHSPTKNGNEIIKPNDNIKIDYGVHINGWIVDSAFTYNISKKHDKQNAATLEELMNGIKAVGIDAPVNDVSRAIQEVIESTEIEYNNKLIPLKLINNVSGHGISRYNIHAEPRIDNIIDPLNTFRFKKGIYALEPLTSLLNSNYFCYTSTNNNVYRLKKPNQRLFKLFKNFSFRYEDMLYYNISQEDIDYYINNKIIILECDLVSVPGDIVTHFEHTIYLDENKKILLT